LPLSSISKKIFYEIRKIARRDRSVQNRTGPRLNNRRKGGRTEGTDINRGMAEEGREIYLVPKRGMRTGTALPSSLRV
jgi:hypothetical protein